MATGSPASGPLTGVDARRDRYAGRRILRQVSLFIAAGYVMYAVLCIPLILAAARVTAAWWTPVALVLSIGTGLAMGPLSRHADIRRLRIVAGVNVVGYLLVGVLWWPAWDGSPLGTAQVVWFALFPGLAAISAALAFPPWAAFGVLAVFIANTGIIDLLARPTTETDPFLPGLFWGYAFSLIFVAAAVMGIRVTGILDSSRARALSATAAAAAAGARSAERHRFDALTHDSVMSTLLLAARNGASPELAQSAREALAAVEQAADPVDRSTVTAPEACEHIAGVVMLVDPTMRARTVIGDAHTTYPGNAVMTIAAATAEAVRNSRRHAGEGATTSVSVTTSPDELCVDIVDDGAGFDPATVPASRLGIAVSIRGRMRRLSGGDATIDSRPGHGTRVHLRWRR